MTSFAAAIAARIHTERYALSARWLERLTALIPVAPNEVFASDALLDHIPSLIEEIGTFISAPEREIASNTFVVGKARELGALRHQQHASVHQLLREYELLRGILESFVGEEATRLGLEPDLMDVLRAVQRINHAVALLTQTTVDTFVERYTATIEDQTKRLAGFNQMVSHELRQPLGTLQTATALLRQTYADADTERRQRLVAAIERSVTRLADLLATITNVTARGVVAPEDAKPGVQRVSLTMVAQEAARQLRDSAESRGVQVMVAPDLPQVTVDVGRLELMLTNLLSNAIKYSDPAKPHRFVDVSLGLHDAAECSFRVRDNGLGMTREQADQMFTPFFRGHAERDRELGVEGLGLGLSIVRDCADAIGATMQVEAAPGEGTTFTITVPNGTCSQ